MHSFAPHALVALALSALVAAVPTTSSTTPFSFVQWVEDIIANPDGDHLSPEEAVAKKAAEGSHDVVKRANCNQNFARADVSSKMVNVAALHTSWNRDCRITNIFIQGNGAAYCLGYLAGLGSKGVNCSIDQNQYNVQMWKQGNAKIVGVKTTAPAVGVNWYVRGIYSIYLRVLFPC